MDVSLLDILRAINQPGFSDQRVAVVGYSSIINSVKKVFEVLQLKNTEIYEVRYAEVKERVAELADRGFSLIIGDVPSVNAAMANGLRGLLILLYPPVRYCSHLLFGVDGKGAGDHSDFSDSY